MVLQSQANWGAIERKNQGKRIVRSNAIDLHESAVAAWLVEACLRNAGHDLNVASIDSAPIIYPFTFGGSTSYILSMSRSLEMRVDGGGNRVINLAN